MLKLQKLKIIEKTTFPECAHTQVFCRSKMNAYCTAGCSAVQAVPAIIDKGILVILEFHISAFHRRASKASRWLAHTLACGILFSIYPIIFSAALTGIGLTSPKTARIRGTIVSCSFAADLCLPLRKSVVI